MEYAQIAINDDDGFYLSLIPTIDDLLILGLTFIVEKEFQRYHDMTLIQYSIAKRKPKALKAMLKKSASCKIPFNEIILPHTSNTCVNLFKLAIIFGTSGPYYDTNDTRCLEILIQFAQDDNQYYQGNEYHFDINFVSQNSEPPLITAIRLRNEDEIALLLNNGADLFHRIKSDDANENNYEFIYSNMPIITLFKLYDNRSRLEDLFNLLLRERKNDIIQECLKTVINRKKLVDFLDDINLSDVREYLIYHSVIVQPSISTLSIPQKDSNENVSSSHKQENVIVPGVANPSVAIPQRCLCGNGIVVRYCHMCKKGLCAECLNLDPSSHGCSF